VQLVVQGKLVVEPHLQRLLVDLPVLVQLVVQGKLVVESHLQ
jgi:hypothetical protein